MIDTHLRFRLSLAVILRSDLEVSDQQHEFQVFKFLFRLVMGICTCFRMGTDLHPLTRNERCPPLPTPWVDNAGVRRRECRDGQGGWMKYYGRTPTTTTPTRLICGVSRLPNVPICSQLHESAELGEPALRGRESEAFVVVFEPVYREPRFSDSDTLNTRLSCVNLDGRVWPTIGL